MVRDYYVYALLRADGTPFYIGKGKGDRWLRHERPKTRNTNFHKAHIVGQLMKDFGQVPKLKIMDGLTDAEAKELEVVLIQLIGRRPNGPLVNATRGGDGGELSEETRRKMGIAKSMDWANPENRRQMIAGFKRAAREPARAKYLSARLRAMWADPETREIFIAAQYRPDVVAKRLAAHLGKKRSAAARQNMAAAQIDRFSDDNERARISALQRAGWTEQAKADFSIMRQRACRDAPRQWITNGTTETLALKTKDIPEGWRRGRCPRFRNKNDPR